MESKKLLAALLPGFLPIIVFVAAESLWGTSAALLSALLFSFGELIYIYFREKKIEKIVFLDMILIIALGVVSFVSENDIFFKLKPVLFEVIFVIFFAVSIYTPLPLIQKMMEKQMKRAEITIDFNHPKLRAMLKAFMIIMVIHIAATVFSAFFMSSAVWGFVSGPFLFILFGIYMGFEFIRNRAQRKK